MDRKGRLMFRPAARVGVVASSIAALALLLFPNAAFASTQIGSPQGNSWCQQTPFDSVQLVSSGSSYAVPSGGSSITSWSFQSTIYDSGFAALEVWRPTAPPTYTLVGLSPLVALNPAPVKPIVLAAPIAVQPGDLIGVGHLLERLDLTPAGRTLLIGVEIEGALELPGLRLLVLHRRIILVGVLGSPRDRFVDL